MQQGKIENITMPCLSVISVRIGMDELIRTQVFSYLKTK